MAEEILQEAQALRSLVHFYNVWKYLKSMDADIERIGIGRDGTKEYMECRGNVY